MFKELSPFSGKNLVDLAPDHKETGSKTEIERKFSVKTYPTNLEQYSFAELGQAYLPFEGGEKRVREKNKNGKVTYVETIKTGSGLSRTESEREISKEEFEEAWESSQERVVKTRYTIPLEGGLKAELDIYGEKLAGLMTVEVEFNDLQQAQDFVAPEWFGEEKTGNESYSNASLAKNGLPD